MAIRKMIPRKRAVVRNGLSSVGKAAFKRVGSKFVKSSLYVPYQRYKQFDRRLGLINRSVGTVTKDRRFSHSEDLSNLMKEAYHNHSGFAIGIIDGVKSMCVAGTRTLRDWGRNIRDVTRLGRFAPQRRKHISYLEKFAKNNDVKCVYGHSRGAALVSDMRVPGIKKVGLDGAMIIANNKKMTNYHTGDLFDRFLALGGKRNYKDNRLKGFHHVY